MDIALQGCFEFFVKGKYQCCQERLNDMKLKTVTLSLQNSESDNLISATSTGTQTVSHFIYDLIVENNQNILSMYRNKTINQSVTDELEACVKCIRQMEEQLNKCRTLPPKLKLLPAELITLNNVVLLHLQTARLKRHVKLSKVFRELSRSLYRVSKSIHSPLPVHNILECDEAEAFVDLTESCVNGLLSHYSSDGCTVIHYIQQLVCSVILFLLMIGEDDVIESLLDIIDLHELPEIHSEKQNGEIYHYAFKVDCRFNHEQDLPQLISVLRGYCHFLKDDFENSVVYLKRIKHVGWKPIASYLIGSTYMSTKKYQEALCLLEEVLEYPDKEIDNNIRARLLNLQGLCLSELDRGHWAVQKFKEAAQLNSNYLPCLFNLSLQYRKQSLNQEELQVLNQVLRLLENEEKILEKHIQKELDLTGILKEILVESDCSKLSLHQILYRSAKRHLELSRFDESAEKYMCLITMLNDKRQLEKNSNCQKIPDVQQIYHETIQALFYTGRYKEGLHLCDKALSCFKKSGIYLTLGDSIHSSFNDSSVFSQSYSPGQCSQFPSTQIRTVNTKKRLRSESYSVMMKETPDNDVLWNVLDEDVAVLILKGQISFKLKDYGSATDCLKRAISCLQKKIGDSSLEHEVVGAAERCTKRRRTASDGTHATGLFTDEEVLKSRFLKLLAEALIHLAEVYIEQENFEDALHSLRSCIQIKSENTRATYMLSNLLIELDFEQEGLETWLNFRSIDHLGDSFQIGTELKRRQERLRSASGENVNALDIGDVPQDKLLAFDMSCLESIMRIKNQQRPPR